MKKKLRGGCANCKPATCQITVCVDCEAFDKKAYDELQKLIPKQTTNRSRRPGPISSTMPHY